MSLTLPKISALDLRPSAGARPLPGGATYQVTRTAGAYKGTLSNWITSRLGLYSEGIERHTISTRAQDLVANDPHAASIIDAMGTNVVGTGLTPQSRPNIKILGWTEEEGKIFQEQAEWAFSIWSAEADARGRLPFWAIQYLSILSMMTNGEFFRLPVMSKDPGRTFSFALQCIDPLRLMTPCDLTWNPQIRDGVVLDPQGKPQSYWIACPPPTWVSYLFSLSSLHCRLVPARIGHRPGVFHVFMQREDEQIRGVSVLAPAMKFFKDLSDYLDFELVGAIVAASFPVFIESMDPNSVAGQFGPMTGQNAADTTQYGEFSPGGVYYGGPGEKPHILKSERPSQTFSPFVQRLLHAIGASVGLPYEVVTKDFSNTNYSSARAALLEACRVFGLYQKWLVGGFCQPVWEMVLEEAWLRGMITLPKGSPDWYEARHAYTRATWIPPKRGSVDPLKEMTALVMGKDHNILTLAKIEAELGDDWEAVINQAALEKQKQKDLGILPADSTNATAVASAAAGGNNNGGSGNQAKIALFKRALALLEEEQS